RHRRHEHTAAAIMPVSSSAFSHRAVGAAALPLSAMSLSSVAVGRLPVYRLAREITDASVASTCMRWMLYPRARCAVLASYACHDAHRGTVNFRGALLRLHA